jgi:hypothetical protein
MKNCPSSSQFGLKSKFLKSLYFFLDRLEKNNLTLLALYSDILFFFRIFYKLTSLKRLDLSGNNLLVMDEEVFRDIR